MIFILEQIERYIYTFQRAKEMNKIRRNFKDIYILDAIIYWRCDYKQLFLDTLLRSTKNAVKYVHITCF
ncbi:hypothetical protein CVS40_7740 [Lucilia cuprina]|nr:hypothetical protein CVS40_7740 [Lucilia cuprina]